MESSGFFNAEIQSDGSYDRVYMAEQFAKYFSTFIGNGVFITPATQLKVVPKDGEMSIGISVGDAYINGYWYQNNSLMYKKLSNANGTQARIDRVVIRWDSSTRTIYADVLEGTPAAIPEAPQVTRSADIYELALADIAIGKAVTEIKTENITDLRNNSTLCGYVKGVVDQIDTTDLFSQFTAAFNSWFADLQSKGNARYETFDELLTQYSKEFDTWFEGIKSQLEGDVATKLTQQISDLQENKADKTDVGSLSKKHDQLSKKVSELSKTVDTKASKSVSSNYTILASGWSGSSAPYSFTLSATGVTASNNVELVVPPTITVAQVEAYQSAAIVTGTQANGSITLKAYGEKPKINLPITVIVRGD